jgi:hypothetical protein
MPSATEVQEFSEQLYYALDPQDRGYVDLRVASQHLSSLAPAVAEFVRRVLAAAEDEFDPSAFVFKVDLIGRLIFAVGQEYDRLTTEETPIVDPRMIDRPLVSREPIDVPQTTASPQAAGQVPSVATAAPDAIRRRDVSQRQTALLADSLRECTFTPKVGRPPRPATAGSWRRSPTPPPRLPTDKYDLTVATSGAQLKEAVDTKFRKSLRRGAPDLTRLTKPTENVENRGYSRGFLMFRINEADKFHGLTIANVSYLLFRFPLITHKPSRDSDTHDA